jgi:polyhydroxybutyrate depolymerase
LRNSFVLVHTSFGGEVGEEKNAVKRDLEETIASSELIRHYYMHLPPGYRTAQSVPLLIALHGRLGTGKRMSKQTGFNEIADREGFIVVYPDGIKRSWADGRGITRADEQNIDDVAFLDKLIQNVAAEFPVDLAGVYLVGHSNGGFMALRFCVELPHRIAALAVVAASLTDSLANRLQAGGTGSILFVHGTADDVTPYDGCRLPGGGRTLSVEDAAKKWATAHGCSRVPVRGRMGDLRKNPNISVLNYGPCQNQNQVRLFRIEDGGHRWPGESKELSKFGDGRMRQELNASEVIWKFFKGAT